MPEEDRSRTAAIARARRTLVGLYDRMARDDIFTLAASIAYAAILSVFPLLLLLIAILGRIEQAHPQEAVVRMLAPYLPPSALTMIRRTLTAAGPTAGTAGIAALVGLLWSTTALAGAARHSLNRILGARRQRPLWRRKLVELSMVAAVSIFLSSSLLANAITAFPALHLIAQTAQYVVSTPGAAAAEWIGAGVLAWLAFVLVYRFLPNVPVKPRPLVLGSLCAVVLFEATRTGFFWYLRTLARYPAVYGPLVGVVVFMVWVYLVALVFLIGAEVMAMGADRHPDGRADG